MSNSRNESLNLLSQKLRVLIGDRNDWNNIHIQVKKVQKKRPLIKNKVLQYYYCYSTNVHHGLPESANVLASVCTCVRLY